MAGPGRHARGPGRSGERRRRAVQVPRIRGDGVVNLPRVRRSEDSREIRLPWCGNSPGRPGGIRSAGGRPEQLRAISRRSISERTLGRSTTRACRVTIACAPSRSRVPRLGRVGPISVAWGPFRSRVARLDRSRTGCRRYWGRPRSPVIDRLLRWAPPGARIQVTGARIEVGSVSIGALGAGNPAATVRAPPAPPAPRRAAHAAPTPVPAPARQEPPPPTRQVVPHCGQPFPPSSPPLSSGVRPNHVATRTCGVVSFGHGVCLCMRADRFASIQRFQ